MLANSIVKLIFFTNKNKINLNGHYNLLNVGNLNKNPPHFMTSFKPLLLQKQSVV